MSLRWLERSLRAIKTSWRYILPKAGNLSPPETNTPWKINMEPKSPRIDKENNLPKLLCSMLIFQGVSNMSGISSGWTFALGSQTTRATQWRTLCVWSPMMMESFHVNSHFLHLVICHYTVYHYISAMIGIGDSVRSQVAQAHEIHETYLSQRHLLTTR